MVVTDHHIVNAATEFLILSLEIKNLALELISALISCLSLVSTITAIAFER
jgi:hypothetical protein